MDSVDLDLAFLFFAWGALYVENQYLALNYELSLSLFYNFISFSSSYIHRLS